VGRLVNSQGTVLIGSGSAAAVEDQGAQVGSDFSCLSTAQAELLTEVLARRNSALLERVRQASVVSQSNAEEIVTVLSDELAENLDDDWEPTDYGRTVSAVLAQFNAARINEWP
jgi:hypothetical protein